MERPCRSPGMRLCRGRCCCFSGIFLRLRLSFLFWNSPDAELREAKTSATPVELKRNGLLGMVRHPMYLALILYLWCHHFRMMDLVVNTLLTLYVLIGTWLEERKLVLEFGEAYLRYQRQVPMLIPFAISKRN